MCDSFKKDNATLTKNFFIKIGLDFKTCFNLLFLKHIFCVNLVKIIGSDIIRVSRVVGYGDSDKHSPQIFYKDHFSEFTVPRKQIFTPKSQNRIAVRSPYLRSLYNSIICEKFKALSGESSVPDMSFRRVTVSPPDNGRYIETGSLLSTNLPGALYGEGGGGLKVNFKRKVL